MSHELKHKKLGTDLIHGEKANTNTRLKFTDHATERFQGNFIGADGKTRSRVRVPYDVSRNSSLKGLKLCHYRRSKKKFFQLQFWFNDRSDFLTIGEFRPGIFGVSQCEDKVYEIVKEHTNEKGIWINNPRLTVHDEETKITKATIEQSQRLTIRQVIERICIDEFPKAKKEGRLSVNSMKEMVKFLIGYNWRSRHLIFTENSKGYGRVSFKANRHKRTAKPNDWEDLFKKFPAGHGIIKDKKFNPLLETCLYDSDLGKLVIDELNEGIVRKYIDKTKRSFGTKDNLLGCIIRLWNYAISNSLFGDVPPTIEFKNISFKRPDESKSNSAKYSDIRFNDNELPIIYNALTKRLLKYPYQAEALMMLMFTGRRESETLKLKWSDVSFEKGVITMPRGITKARKVEYIDITGPVAVVLAHLKQKQKGEYQKYSFIDWLFPTLRTNTERLHEDDYVRSNATRIKSLRGCWEDLVKETRIVGSPKMFRKTFSSIAKIKLGTSSKARALTGHEQDATLDIHYDKTPRDKAKEYAHQVAEVFDFAKKTG